MFVNLAPNEYIYLFYMPVSFLDIALENTLFFISGIPAILILYTAFLVIPWSIIELGLLGWTAVPSFIYPNYFLITF